MPNVTLNWEKLGGGCKTTASPDSHALLNVSGGNLITQVHHKLGKLFDIDDVFGVFRVSVDDLCASVGTMERRRNLLNVSTVLENSCPSSWFTFLFCQELYTGQNHRNGKTLMPKFALPCYLQRLFTLQSLFVGSQIPESGWRQTCVGLLDAFKYKCTTQHPVSTTVEKPIFNTMDGLRKPETRISKWN